MNIDLQIVTDNAAYRPIVLDGITWTTERLGAPSKLRFTVVKDSIINFGEGANVALRVDGTPVFFGYVFEKSRDRDQHIEVLAYDQLRYFKNKETYQYTNKRADEVLTGLAKDFRLKTGSIANTGFKIKARDEDNQTLFDIVLNALDLTYDSTGREYVLYDDFGAITLKSLEDMKVDMLVNADVAENFDYTTSIDKDTYNYVKIRQETDEQNVRKVYVVEDSTLQGKWGILRFVLDVDKDNNGANLANTIAKLKGRKTRDLTVTGIKGDFRIRAGCIVPVELNLGDFDEKIWMQCDSVTHKITADHHTMDIAFFDSTVRV